MIDEHNNNDYIEKIKSEYESLLAYKENELKKVKEDLNGLLAFTKKELSFAYKRLDSQTDAIKMAKIHCQAMLGAKIFKLVHLWSRIKIQLIKGNLSDKIAFFKWIFNREKYAEDTYQPLCSIDRALNTALRQYTPMPDFSYDTENICLLTSDFMRYTHNKAKEYNYILTQPLSTNALKIRELLNNHNYKGIMIYPHIINWEPFQTPQQLLIGFAEEGWLSLFCESPAVMSEVTKIQDNLYLVNEEDVLQAIGDTEVTVLLTWMGSLPFINRIKNKKIWYNVLDQLDIFAMYDPYYQTAHDEIIKEVDHISYVADALTKHLYERKNEAIYLPNGCHAEKLLETTMGDIPSDLTSIIEEEKPIIGYFGWISEWFDYDTLAYTAKECPDCNFVLIGPVNTWDTNAIEGVKKLEEVSNIYLLGRKKYEELPAYARRFTVATIPFQINEMMDCVSPIKFYEYCAYGLPTISSYMPEMEKCECDFVACYHNKEEYVDLIKQYIQSDILEKARKYAPEIAINNTWRARVKRMEDVLL